MAQIWRWELLDPLKARSQWPQTWLGFPYAEIEPRVLEMGRADFRQGYSDPTYGTLTPEDRVLLYCFMNLRLHYYESLATFRDYDLSPVLSPDAPTLFVDLGCGPGTAGLAFAEYLHGSHAFDYYPVDLAPAMLDRAASLFVAARNRNLGNGSIGQYITGGDTPHRRVIFNASYLFASYTLDVTWIVDAVKQAMSDADVVFFIYTNSTNPQAGQKWQQFCAALGISNFATQATVEYLNNSYDVTPKKRDYMRAVVQVK